MATVGAACRNNSPNWWRISIEGRYCRRAPRFLDSPRRVHAAPERTSRSNKACDYGIDASRPSTHEYPSELTF